MDDSSEGPVVTGRPIAYQKIMEFAGRFPLLNYAHGKHIMSQRSL